MFVSGVDIHYWHIWLDKILGKYIALGMTINYVGSCQRETRWRATRFKGCGRWSTKSNWARGGTTVPHEVANGGEFITCIANQLQYEDEEVEQLMNEGDAEFDNDNKPML
jgi:hypothetical protein